MESPLGCGWSLRGTHRDLTYPAVGVSPSLSADAYTLGSTDHDDRRPTSRCPDGSGGGGQDGAAAVIRRLQGVVGPSPVRNDVKLGGLGLPAAGDSPALTITGSPSPPLLQEDKLSGPVAGGTSFVRLRQEGKLTLQHEVKLSGLGQMCLHSRRIQSGIKHSRLSSPWRPQVSSPILAEVNRPYEKVLSAAGIKALKSSCSIVLLLLLTICVFGSSISQDCPTPEVVGPSAVRNDVKLGGLGLSAAGDRPVLSVTRLAQSSPPTRGKTVWARSRGQVIVRLCQEGKLTLHHEVKLSGLGTGDRVSVGSARRVSWPSVIEVKLSGLVRSLSSIKKSSRRCTHVCRLPGWLKYPLSLLAKVDRPYKKVLPVGSHQSLKIKATPSSSFSCLQMVVLGPRLSKNVPPQKHDLDRTLWKKIQVRRLQPPTSSPPSKSLVSGVFFPRIGKWKMSKISDPFR